ncbi:mucin-2-like [Macrobrachium nipponense]|uniref:mucin-2-like n=1 Tax=Macrobrachium nipponense TaxID=159736 RepID=UPI0030C8B1A0
MVSKVIIALVGLVALVAADSFESFERYSRPRFSSGSAESFESGEARYNFDWASTTLPPATTSDTRRLGTARTPRDPTSSTSRGRPLRRWPSALLTTTDTSPRSPTPVRLSSPTPSNPTSPVRLPGGSTMAPTSPSKSSKGRERNILIR